MLLKILKGLWRRKDKNEERRLTLQLSADAERLIDHAAQAQGIPRDLAAWARRLAEDVRDLTD